MLIFKDLAFVEVLRFSCCGWGLLGYDTSFIGRTTCCLQACPWGLSNSVSLLWQKTFWPWKGCFSVYQSHWAVQGSIPVPPSCGSEWPSSLQPCFYSKQFLLFAVEPWRWRYIFIWSVGVLLRDYIVSTQKTSIWVLLFNFGLHYSSCLRGKHDGHNRVCFLLLGSCILTLCL